MPDTPERVEEALRFPALDLIRKEADEIARNDARFHDITRAMSLQAKFADDTISSLTEAQAQREEARKALRGLVAAAEDVGVDVTGEAAIRAMRLAAALTTARAALSAGEPDEEVQG